MSDLGFLPVLFIAFGLSGDCFAVALSGSISHKSLSFPQIFRVAFSFGAFQAFMPVLGWLAGRSVVNLISGYDHWIAFALLGFIGGKMVWDSIRGKEDYSSVTDVTKGVSILVLSVATSIDALAVGLTFAFLNTSIVFGSITIGVVAFVVTTIGFMIGKKAGGLIGKRAELVGGAILIGIGIKIVIEHTL
ncbi:MAG: manganese efflux pump MntP family protein [Dehalococcoidia bacterium]|nr:manganese efflux pump MntP family protein [Dehalococcoidia bacterium]